MSKHMVTGGHSLREVVPQAFPSSTPDTCGTHQ